MLVCPVCRAPLTPIEHGSARAALCSTCHGVFVAREDLVALLGPATASLKGARQFPVLAFGAPDCPAGCGKLHAIGLRNPGHQRVEIDVCDRCGGMWFDRGEIQAIKRTHHGPPPAPVESTGHRAAQLEIDREMPEDRGEGLLPYLFQFFSGLPIEGHNRLYRRPILTWLLMAICVFVFYLEVTKGERYIMANALVPGTVHSVFEFFRQSLGSMFLHGSGIHLLGNMYFLWIFGDNVEDRVGRFWFIPLYLFCGFAAAYAQYRSDATSMLPVVGASGAIGGMLGAYTLFFPEVRVRVAPTILTLFHRLSVPAILYLPWWFGWQVLAIMLSSDQSVAFWAHAGGFLAGVACAFVARYFNLDARVAALARSKKI